MLFHMLVNGVSNSYGNQTLTTMDSPFTGANYSGLVFNKEDGPRGFLEWQRVDNKLWIVSSLMKLGFLDFAKETKSSKIDGISFFDDV